MSRVNDEHTTNNNNNLREFVQLTYPWPPERVEGGGLELQVLTPFLRDPWGCRVISKWLDFANRRSMYPPARRIGGRAPIPPRGAALLRVYKYEKIRFVIWFSGIWAFLFTDF